MKVAEASKLPGLTVFNYLTSVYLLYNITRSFEKISSAAIMRKFFAFSETAIFAAILIKYKSGASLSGVIDKTYMKED